MINWQPVIIVFQPLFSIKLANLKNYVIILVIVDRMIIIYLDKERRYYVYKTRSKAEFESDGYYAQ